jgi:SAM-dependent methyltransferase
MKRYRAIAEYYDFENERLPWLLRDVPFFLDHLPKRRRLDVLELACGTGRAAIPIAQAGHRVVGIDYAPEMLAIARRKRDAVGLGERELNLVPANALELDLHRKFDVVAIFFNTFLAFTTLAEQDRLLAVVRRHLKRGGTFWLDVFQPNLSILSHDINKGIEAAVFYVPALERTVYTDCDLRVDPSRQLQHVTFNYRWFDARGFERREKREFELTFLFPRELQILLERNGFRLEKLFGDYDGVPMDADSPRMIARCRLA